MSGPKPAVLVVNSQVARGGVGGRAAVFTLERLGYSVWFVPTITLPFHPGHGRATRLLPEPGAFAGLCADLSSAPWLPEIRAVLTGYLGDAVQAEPVARLIRAVKAARPDALVLCDPVLGDHGQLYVPAAIAEAIRDRLLPLADIATPNAFEFGWLSGEKALDHAAIVAAARTLGPAWVVVTSAPGLMRTGTANLFVGERRALLAEHPRVDNAPHGAGDLFAALFLAKILDGLTDEAALRAATAATFEAVMHAARSGDEELRLARDQDNLVSPTATLVVRRLGEAPRRA